MQTKKQVLRRLWGILENQTFERMFAHPRSKLDLFAEMNAGKVILIDPWINGGPKTPAKYKGNLEALGKIDLHGRRGVTLGKDVTLDELKQRHQAVLVTIGSWWGKPMGIPGETNKNVVDGVGFPCIIRPSFTMGGSGGGIAYNREEFEDIINRGGATLRPWPRY